MTSRDNQRASGAIVSLILLCMSLQLTAAMLFGRCFFGPGWFGTTKEIAAYSVSALLFVLHRVWGRKRVAGAFDPQTMPTRNLSALDALMVIVLVIAAGCFGTWLFVGN